MLEKLLYMFCFTELIFSLEVKTNILEYFNYFSKTKYNVK